MKRWEVAQQSEKAFWEESFHDEKAFQRMCLDFYPVYTGILTRNGFDTEGMRMLDVGSGPYGFLSVIPGKEKCLLDPLMDVFMDKVPAKFYLDRNLSVYKSVGENIPFEDKYFDMVCCLNTLDHAEDPESVMEEANRCLKDKGYLLLSVNHYAAPIVFYRKFLEMIGLGDRNHPNTYHLEDINKIIFTNGFKILDLRIGDVKESKEKIAEVGGTINISLGQRMQRALKTKGLWYVIKQAIVAPGHYIFNKIFKTYPDSIFLCEKMQDLK